MNLLIFKAPSSILQLVSNSNIFSFLFGQIQVIRIFNESSLDQGSKSIGFAWMNDSGHHRLAGTGKSAIISYYCMTQVQLQSFPWGKKKLNINPKIFLTLSQSLDSKGDMYRSGVSMHKDVTKNYCEVHLSLKWFISPDADNPFFRQFPTYMASVPWPLNTSFRQCLTSQPIRHSPQCAWHFLYKLHIQHCKCFYLHLQRTLFLHWGTISNGSKWSKSSTL